MPSLALVGYTNAGKSTLFRALTGADAYVADQLFATLDPTVRRLVLPGGTPVVVADTVGFIRELPHELVAAFQSTLTEARAATLLLHVVDASNARRAEQIAQVDSVLEEIGAAQIPQLIVYNKIDRLEIAPRIERDAEGRAQAVWICAQRAEGLDLLLSAVAERLARFARRARLRVPASAGALRSRLYAAQAVRGETSAPDGSIELAVELPDLELLTLARTDGVQILEVQGTQTCLVPRRSSTYNRRALSSAVQVAPAAQSLLWPGINRTVVRTARGGAVRARAARTSTSASRACSAGSRRSCAPAAAAAAAVRCC